MKYVLLITFLFFKFVGNAKTDTTYFRDGDRLRQVIADYGNLEMREKSIIDTLQYDFSTKELAMFFRDNTTLQKSKILINSLIPFTKQEELVTFWNSDGTLKKENKVGEPEFDLFLFLKLMVWPLLVFLLTGLFTPKEKTVRWTLRMLGILTLTILTYVVNPLLPFSESLEALMLPLTVVFTAICFFIWYNNGFIGGMVGISLGYALSDAIYLSHNTELKIQYTKYLVLVVILSYLIFKLKHSLRKNKE